MKNIKKYISLFLIIVALFLVVNTQVKAEGEGFSLGQYDFKTESFKNAKGTGTELYKSILIAYGKDPNSSEKLELPDVDGFVKSTDASTNYSIVINMPNGKTPEEIGNYVKEIKFKNSSDGQIIQIVISDTVINNKTFYYQTNQHYYQYIKYTDIGTGSSNPGNHSWVDAYNLAKNLTYGGRQGYLATITSFEEDLFIYNASNSIGWLGGTVLTHGDTEGDLYYSSFNKNSGESVWYWADGPERGQVFFNGKGSGAYQKNDEAGYYFNWANGEPNKSKFDQESCLTSLRTGVGYAARKAGSSVQSSWNDAPENSQSYHGTYGVKGYFVEYGDQVIGDSGKNSGDNIITSATIIYPSVSQKELGILTYDGQENKPTIIIEFENNILVEGKDYEIQYVGVQPTEYGPSATAPTEKGTYKAIIEFKGDYEGITKEETFSIVKSDLIVIIDPKEPNAYNAEIKTNSKDLFDKIKLTSSEINDLLNNKEMYIYIEVKDITDTILDTDKEFIENLLDNNLNTKKYFDVSLLKRIEDGENEKITELNKPIDISFTIPEELLNTNKNVNRTYEIYVLHNGKISKTNVKVDGNIATFEADKFSIYTLTYTDTEVINNPNTVDNIIIYISILGLSMLGLIIIGKKIIKQNN